MTPEGLRTLEVPLHRLKRPRGAVAFQAEPRPLKVPSLSRSLAFGYYCALLVESGEARDYGRVAARFGISQAQVSHLVQLTFLAPDIQTELLQGRIPLPSQALRRLGGVTAWVDQRILLKALLETKPKLRVMKAIGRQLEKA